LDHKWPLGDARVRDAQVGPVNMLGAEQQDVHIYDAGTPTSRGPAPAFALDSFGRRQQRAWGAAPFDLQDLVEETRLVGDTPGLGFYDAAMTQYPRAF